MKAIEFLFSMLISSCLIIPISASSSDLNVLLKDNQALNVCGLPVEIGPCNAAIPRYYYDTSANTCLLFNYGGCGGNANNYESFNACIEVCGNPCQLEPEVGPCDAVIPRYYYDTSVGTCLTFNYGGCGGNTNNYTTFNACIASCGSNCQLEPEVGPCEAVIPRYYYDTSAGTCLLFNYGGCGGNANNYMSFNACIDACGSTCQLEPDVGPCDGSFPRYYFNSISGICEIFNYGGCDGNANRYLTKAACMESCGDVCYLPPEQGPCEALIPRYYYNPDSGDCELFTYGGCGGNANNYVTYSECMGSCAEVCDMPADVGDCDAAIPRYYYDKSSSTCKIFIWGGCGGNENKFVSMTECMEVCPCREIVLDDELYLSEMNVTKSAQMYLKSRSILTDEAKLLYSARDSVVLLSGFLVRKNAVLQIVLDGCIN